MARAGNLNKRVTFQAESPVADGGGGNTLTWTNVTTVWASFSPERGKERLQAARLEASLAGILRVRSSTVTRALTPKNRVLIAGEPYQIRSIANPDARNRMLEMTVESGGDAGVAT